MNLKKLNVGLVALLLGFGLVVTQSAFKSAKLQEYGKLETSPGNHIWVDIASLDYVSPENELEEGQYTCDDSEIENCTAFFESQPMPNTPDPENGQPGIFRQYTP